MGDCLSPFVREVARKCRMVLSFTPHRPLGTISCLGFTPRSRSIAYELRSAGFIRSLSGLTSFRPLSQNNSPDCFVRQSVNPPQEARGLVFTPLAKGGRGDCRFIILLLSCPHPSPLKGRSTLLHVIFYHTICLNIFSSIV